MNQGRHAQLGASQLANLNTFVNAAQNLSFTQTAQVLYLTPSAVSHRIGKLEQELGFKLFHRLHKQLKLTEEGARLFRSCTLLFSQLDEELNEIRTNELSGRLTIYARPSITQCWLVPRIHDFHQAYPAIQLDILTGNEDVNFRTQFIDVALYYASGPFPGLASIKLMSEEVTPVCSLDYAERFDLIGKPHNLSQCTLLHDCKAWPQAAFNAEWLEWAKYHQIMGIDNSRSLSFDRSDLAVIAAMNNAGLAIGRKRLVDKRLRSGELIAPFASLSTPASYQYHAVYSADIEPNPRVQAFLNWLKQQADEGAVANRCDSL
ncbi:DNA-binding transcriptional regulator DsdC [Shewanella sp. YLB-07]|uniref:DNA-binding transcriptional regulator DsdC n=1 Tax=Shewanella sp. YLB-07 TaxID=2601268 RepID=UPI00128CD877|nr:DNA-binding transcriptional regulator DsdC [Shewanella sp. YLB-07]MPY26828.1 DNA-binding transcriptional regulator DsdC [Shewanella sp. YLB-07]